LSEELAPGASKGAGLALAEAPSTSPGKRYRVGAHRERTPEETWEWVRPVLSQCGISRVADVTRLDRIGIPVFQAVRPASRNLSVSQGKGATPMAARVSAVMESIELHHAEDLSALPVVSLSIREMRYANAIPIESLRWASGALYAEAAPIEWLAARSLLDGRRGWLPRQMMELDFRRPRRFAPKLFDLTSNGLASGNTRDEALLHGLCELIERHALYRVQKGQARKKPIATASISVPYCQEMVEAILDAGGQIAIYDIGWEVGVPTFVVDCVFDDLPRVWRGSGAHPAPDVALSRAISEAAQSRLTYISGAREDVVELDGLERPDLRYQRFRATTRGDDFEAIPGFAGGAVASDLHAVVERLQRLGLEPFALDLERPQLGIPVSMVFVPGLKDPPHG
jgi:YcaO-like protein with predicted kinase domain